MAGDDICMLLPMVFTIAFVVSRRAADGKSGAKVNLPLFPVGFAVLVALNSAGLLSEVTTNLANDVSR
ncbi:putative sulfate exporter family transporter [Rhodoblastus sp. 17X3]|uniref:putative sulfate exporter family transporter n=1 Tax=Rhodoblastus sp. 17X3 TaxID=3047026 RepID=UPI0024B7205C|nr:putative sulfate exporter family transporter [Rhodoblastus sp. 17X3]MDI9850237.1 putative sulfate exporter family transporter [Rhodoblastus sp. 17X3]